MKRDLFHWQLEPYSDLQNTGTTGIEIMRSLELNTNAVRCLNLNKLSMSQTRLFIIAVLLYVTPIYAFRVHTAAVHHASCISKYCISTLVAHQPCKHYNCTTATRYPYGIFQYFTLSNGFKDLYEFRFSEQLNITNDLIHSIYSIKPKS